MNLFSRMKKAFSRPANRGGWLPIIRESYGGAWQQNVEIDNDTALTYFAVFSCITLIAGDIAKLPVRLLRDVDGIHKPEENQSYTPVLRKPNGIQNRIQFWENYFLSKLSNGNTYVLKRRDTRGLVRALYVLAPERVQPLITPAGDVFYQLSSDNISGIEEPITVPASEVIHDRMNCLFHPLVGLSPIISAGLAAMQGHNIQTDSTNFFANRGIPGGVLTAPGAISDETAKRLKEYWETNFTGENAGKVAIAGDGLKFEPMRMTAENAQVIEQLRWSAEVVCSVFHVPPYKIGIGQQPSYNNIQALNVEYYSQALQVLIEAAELCLAEGLGLQSKLSIGFDIRQLLRMDGQTQINRLKEGIGAGIMAPNEGRAELNLQPVKGGETPYLQQQNFSLAALAERDQNKPFAKPQQPAPANEPLSDDEMDQALEGDA